MTVVASVPRALSELNEADLAVALQGEPAYRRAQLWEGLFRSTAPSLERIHPLPRRLRASIAMLAPFTSLAVQREEVSLDGTRKALFATADGAAVEAVCLPSERGAATTVCVSSQAGCG
ncbi:MAG: 23S rRNA (adenine(2503)-C2)-methyltransferase, partial [Actinobacteria bacterium]|nr:23S rRNA (adenine(2503)-C2)-methyltransferase [Actinomycetota bacterium]